MNAKSSREAEQPDDELEALRAKIAELEASRPEKSEIKELREEVRSSGENVSKTMIYLVIAIAVGSIIGNLLKSPPPTATERLCADYNIKC